MHRTKNSDINCAADVFMETQFSIHILSICDVQILVYTIHPPFKTKQQQRCERIQAEFTVDCDVQSLMYTIHPPLKTK